MTAVEWLVEQMIREIGKRVSVEITPLGLGLIEQAKEMEKEQKKYFFECGRQYQLTGEGTFTEVYNETYGSKGSDDHIVDTNEMVAFQTEISDEKILDAAEDYSDSYLNKGVAMSSFARGCYWYREQLKRDA